MATRTLEELLAAASRYSGYFSEEDLGPDGRVGVHTHGFTGDTPLHLMAHLNDAEGVEILLSAGASPDVQGEIGETPLHSAIRQRSLDAMCALLRAGASLEVMSDFGDTPAKLAGQIGGAVAAMVRESPNYSLKRTNQSLRD